MNEARITVITPSYNQAEFLEETICSVLDQGYGNLEYFVMDGGSRDGSAGIIRKYERHLAGWVSEPDRGQAHALNKGLERATGQMIAFINSDDLLEPGSLEIVNEHFQAGARWVSGAVRLFGPRMKTRIRPTLPERNPADWFGKNLVPQQGSFWSSELTRRLGGFREDLHYVFDREYWMRLRFVGGVRPTIEPRVLASFRHHGTSKTVSELDRFRPEMNAVRKEYSGHLTRSQRMRAWLGFQHILARGDVRASIELSREGRVLRAAGVLGRSVLRWPPLLFARRTGGALRSLARGVHAERGE